MKDILIHGNHTNIRSYCRLSDDGEVSWRISSTQDIFDAITEPFNVLFKTHDSQWKLKNGVVLYNKRIETPHTFVVHSYVDLNTGELTTSLDDNTSWDYSKFEKVPSLDQKVNAIFVHYETALEFESEQEFKTTEEKVIFERMCKISKILKDLEREEA